MLISSPHKGLQTSRIVLFFLLLALAAGSVSAGLLEDAFAPLRDLDVASFYASYSSVIDAIIYCIIFVGLAQVTLGRRFGKTRGSKAIVIGVGLALTFALVVMEQAMDFSLAQFGPYAAAIFVILAASVLFYLLKTLGVDNIGSFTTSYVVVYFLLRAVVPSFFYYLQANAPGLHGLIALGALIALFAALWKLVAGFWPGGGDEKLRITAFPPREEPAGPPAVKAGTGEELRLLRGELQVIQRRRVKDSEAIIADLDNMIVVIDKYGDTAGSRRMIAEALSRDVVPREHRLRTSLRALRKLYGRIEKFELGMLAQLKSLPPAKRKAAEKEIRERLRKLSAEERIKAIEDKMQNHDRLFRSKLKQAVQQVNAGRMDDARKALIEARDAESHIRELEEDIQKLSTLLRGLASREVVKGAAA